MDNAYPEIYRHDDDPNGTDYRQRRHAEVPPVVVKVNGTLTKWVALTLATVLISIGTGLLGYFAIRDRNRVDEDFSELRTEIREMSMVQAEHSKAIARANDKLDVLLARQGGK